ncbi:hypothetical protein MASR1M45_12240 [Candidatus Kapaibacterium sp.]
MAKENFSDGINIASLAEYQSFLIKAIERVKSGQSFDAWISSELIMREKTAILTELQSAEQTHVASILEDELKNVQELIKGS